MKIEKFKKNLLKIAKKHDKNFKEKHNPPYAPYYDSISPACVEYLDYFMDNAEKVDLLEKDSRNAMSMLILPFRDYKSDPKYFRFVFDFIKDQSDCNFIGFVILNTIAYMIDKKDIDFMLEMLEYDYPNLDKTLNSNYKDFDPLWYVKGVLFESLAKTKLEKAKRALLNYLNPSKSTTVKTIRVLKKFKDPSLIVDLEPLLESKNKEIVKEAQKLIDYLKMLKDKGVDKEILKIQKKPENDYFNVFVDEGQRVLSVDLECVDDESVYRDFIETILYFSKNNFEIYGIEDEFDLEEGGYIKLYEKDSEIKFGLKVKDDWMDVDFFEKFLEYANSKMNGKKRLKVLPSEGQDVLLVFE